MTQPTGCYIIRDRGFGCHRRIGIHERTARIGRDRWQNRENDDSPTVDLAEESHGVWERIKSRSATRRRTDADKLVMTGKIERKPAWIGFIELRLVKLLKMRNSVNTLTVFN